MSNINFPFETIHVSVITKPSKYTVLYGGSVVLLNGVWKVGISEPTPPLLSLFQLHNKIGVPMFQAKLFRLELMVR